LFVKDLDVLEPERARRAMVLANDAEHETAAGDPLELALLDHVRAAGIDPIALNRRYPRRSSLPFDSSYKYMRVTVEEDGKPVSYLKGAPEV
ncbi:hypothetical protein OFC00_29020, partial [Escherichia coli]|nr:hypothetical protein [Escherichia coli]